MRYASLLRTAWQLTRKSRRLVLFAMVPALFQVLMVSLQMGWQAYRYSNTFGVIQEESYLSGLLGVVGWIGDRGLWGGTIVLVLLVILFNYLIPPLFRGTVLLGVKHRLERGFGYMSLRQKILAASKLFWPLLEINAIKRFLSIWGNLVWGLSFYRWTIDGDLPIPWPWVRGFLIFLLCLSFLATVFLSFAHYEMAFDGAGFRESIKKSIGLVFVRLGTVLAVALLMLLIQLRVVLNVLLVLGVPLGLSALGAWWLSPVTTVLVWVLALGVLGLVSYLNAMIDVFTDAVWAQVYFRVKAVQAEEA